MDTPCRLLIFGDTAVLKRLAAHLGRFPLIMVIEQPCGDMPTALDELHANVILVDAAQATPEQFGALLAARSQPPPAIISIDPSTYQLTVLSYPNAVPPLADIARVLGMLSLALSQLVRQPGHS